MNKSEKYVRSRKSELISSLSMNNKSMTYVTKDCVEKMKKQIDQVISENTKLKIKNCQLQHQISALKIALEAKELQKCNIVHIYEDLLRSILPHQSDESMQSSQSTLIFENLHCSNYSSDPERTQRLQSSFRDQNTQEFHEQFEQEQVYKVKKIQKSGMSVVSQKIQLTSPNQKTNIPNLELGALTILNDLKKTETKETDTRRESQNKKNNKRVGSKRQASGGTSDSSEVRKLIQVNDKNKQKIERLLKRIRSKQCSTYLLSA